MGAPTMPGVDHVVDAVMISETGHTALWAGFFGMFIPFLYFFFTMFQMPDGKRKFHIYTMLVNAIASVAYLIMASGYGWEIVNERQFFYMRYVDWFFTTPLLLLDLCALGRVCAETTNLLVGVDLLMIVSGLIGASLTADGDYKPWAFFAFGMFFFLPIVYQLGFVILEKIQAPEVKSVYTIVAWLTVLSWSLYPVAWLIAEGTDYVSPDTEVLMYTCIDLLSKSLFGLILLNSHAAIDAALYEAEEEAPLLWSAPKRAADCRDVCGVGP